MRGIDAEPVGRTLNDLLGMRGRAFVVSVDVGVTAGFSLSQCAKCTASYTFVAGLAISLDERLRKVAQFLTASSAVWGDARRQKA